jgi:pSer/pThr/pTyr-binding forkhead associated (FHA) protein
MADPVKTADTSASAPVLRAAEGRFARPGSAAPGGADREGWLERARALTSGPGEYLALDAGDGLRVVPLTREWTRVGRSLAADVRLEDASVSRRHALLVRQPDGVRVLDDRSLNGVFVNGERVDWRMVGDGDEIVVGRYRLTFLVVPRPAAAASWSAHHGS